MSETEAKERSSSLEIQNPEPVKMKRPSTENNASISIPALRLKTHMKSNYPKISDAKEAEEAGFAGQVNLQKKKKAYQVAGIIQEFQLEVVYSQNNGLRNFKKVEFENDVRQLIERDRAGAAVSIFKQQYRSQTPEKEINEAQPERQARRPSP